LNGISSGRIREAVRCFHRGGIIAYPTEAVYGLGCDPLDGAAVYRLLELKQRPVEKGLILIAARFGQLRPYVGEVDEERLRPALESWPGPHTWLLPAAPGLPGWLSGSHDTLAVRVTANPAAAALCTACDSPLVSTSANSAGSPPVRDALGVRRSFGSAVDFILHGDVSGADSPTSIRDLMTGNLIRA